MSERSWYLVALRARENLSMGDWTRIVWNPIQEITGPRSLRLAFWSDSDEIGEVQSDDDLVKRLASQGVEGEVTESVAVVQYDGCLLGDVDIQRRRRPLVRFDISASEFSGRLVGYWEHHALSITLRRMAVAGLVDDASGAASLLARVAASVDADAAFLSTKDNGVTEPFMVGIPQDFRGIPTIGWATYLHPRSYPEAAAITDLEYARQLPNGTVLVEVPERPWDRDNDRVVRSYRDVVEELERRGVLDLPLEQRRLLAELERQNKDDEEDD